MTIGALKERGMPRKKARTILFPEEEATEANWSQVVPVDPLPKKAFVVIEGGVQPKRGKTSVGEEGPDGKKPFAMMAH